MKITLRSILGYLFGIPILLFGLLVLFTTVIGGIALLFAGVIATPYTRRVIQRRTGIEFSTGAAAGIPTILIVLGVIALGMSGAGTLEPGDSVSNVTVDHYAAEIDNPDHELYVTYNTRAQDSVDPDPDSLTHFSSDDGEKYLVVRTVVANEGETDIDMTDRVFQLEVDGVVYDRRTLLGSSHNLGVTIQPGATHSGWVIFAIPEDVTEATLLADEDAIHGETLAVEFNQDESMAINMSA